jgi:glycogen synthase
MKVAMLGWEYPPFKVGGLGTHCYGLTRSLADKDVKVDFYMPKTKHKFDNDKDKENMMPSTVMTGLL